METVTDVDTTERRVYSGEHPLEYDYLVLAPGAEHSYFGHGEWAPHAPGLKTIDDATEVRCRILTAFEQAETDHNTESRQALLTFVVVGAGPTGRLITGPPRG